MKKRIVFALVAVLLVIGYLAQPESDPPELAEPTMAEIWASTANASLDIPMEQFFSQMPDNLASAQWTERVHTMTWADGSVVVTHWKPSSVSGDGLLLDFIGKISGLLFVGGITALAFFAYKNAPF